MNPINRPAPSNIIPLLRALRPARAGAVQAGEGTAAQAGWLMRAGGRPAVDVTRAFHVLAATAEAGTDPLPPEAKHYAYVLVGEPLGTYLPGYLAENLRPLLQRGFDARQLPVETASDVEAGARAVQEAIWRAASGGKQVVLIAHGRGGVDAVNAISLRPDLTPAVRALVALQAPFGGSPLATDLDAALRAELTGPLGGLLHRHPATLAALTYAARQTFVAEHPMPIDVPAVCLATTRRAPGTAMAGAAESILKRFGFESDGLVLPEDAVLPGARLVRLEDMDHAQSVVSGLTTAAHHPADLTLALVALALRAPPPAALALRAAA